MSKHKQHNQRQQQQHHHIEKENTTMSTPTATLSVSPTSISPGQSSTLSWQTTDATTVTIDNGIGTVAASGSQSVTPTASTTYNLSATGPDGTVSASATVTVGATETEQQAVAQVQADISSDVTAVKGALTNVAAQARMEYEQLSEAAKAKLHTLLNDLEQAGGKTLAGIHTLFGATAPTK